MSKTTLDIFSEKLVFFMDEKNIKGYELAEYLGVRPASISEWRKGRSEPSLNKIKSISIYLKIPMSSFFEDNSEFLNNAVNESSINYVKEKDLYNINDLVHEVKALRKEINELKE